MPSLKDWTEAVALVEHLHRLAASPTNSGGLEANQRYARLADAASDAMSPALWRELLSQKVPQQLAAACAKALNTIHTIIATNSSSTPAPSSEQATGAYVDLCRVRVLEVLGLLVTRAYNDLLIYDAEDPQFYTVSDEAAAFCQQIQASGFLERLPQLFSSVIQGMQATGLSAQLKPLPSLAPPLRADASTGSSSSVSDSNQQQDTANISSSPEHVNQPPAPVTELLQAEVLSLYSSLSRVWPISVFATEVAQECTVPALQLAWLAMQHADGQLTALTAGSTNSPSSDSSNLSSDDTDRLLALSHLWTSASDSCVCALGPLGYGDNANCSPHSTTRHKQLLLGCSYTLPCIALLLTPCVYAAMLAQQSQLPRLSTAVPVGSSAAVGGGDNAAAASTTTTTSSSSSGCGSSSTRVHAAAAAWELACRERNNIPATHSLMLSHLGVSRTVLFFSAHWVCNSSRSRGDAAAEQLTHMLSGLEFYNQFLSLTGGLSSTTNAQGRAQSGTSELHILLSHVQLYWAAHHHSSSTLETVQGAKDMSLAVQNPDKVFSRFKCQEGGSAAAAVAPEWVWQLVQEEAPPLVTALSTRLLESLGCKSQRAGGSAATTPTVTGGSSSGSRASTVARHLTVSCEPAITAVQLARCLCLLDATSGRVVLIGRLVEAAVRWGRHAASAHDAYIQDAVMWLLCELCETTFDPQTTSMSATPGFMLTAAQQINPGHNSRSSDLTAAVQLQLASLCFSVLKMLSFVPPALQAMPEEGVPLQCAQIVAKAVSSMLHWLAAPAASPAASSQAGSSSSSCGGAQVAVSAAVPWLVLSGRVLAFVSRLLPAATAHAEVLAAQCEAFGIDMDELARRVYERADGQLVEIKRETGNDKLRRMAGAVIAGLRAWLQMPGAADALAASGYDPSGSLLQQLLATCGEAGSSSNSSAEDVGAQLQPESLRSLANSLNSLPFACACNNPACDNLSGPLEHKLVKGKTCVCSGCHVSKYCSRACQSKHWLPHHKPVCRAIAAVAAIEQAAAGL